MSSSHIILEKTETDICVVGDGEKPFIKLLDYIKSNPDRTNINYDKFSSLSAESKEKLKSIMPKDIAQASRISGIKPSDISILLVYLGR